MEDLSPITIEKPKPSGPFVGTIIILLILCAGAVSVFLMKRAARLSAFRTPSVIYSTTTIDLGTTTIH